MHNSKCLILCNNLAVGGIAKSLLALLKHLHKKGILVDVCALKKSSNAIFNEISKVANIVDIKEINEIGRIPSGLKKIFFILKRKILFEAIALRILNVKKICTEKNKSDKMKKNQQREYKICKNSNIKVDLSSYDCVISWSEMLTNYILSENVICDHKIGWVHPDYKTAGFCPEIDKKSFSKLDVVVAVSKSSCTTLKETFPELYEKFLFIPNLIDVENIRKLSDVPCTEIANEGFKIVTVARLQNVSKAFDRAARIAQRLKENNCKFVWYLVGDGEDRAVIQNDIIDKGISDCFVLLGSKDNPYPYMKAADLFVLQSYYEGRPISVDEAMIVGTPVLVTEYTSANEQISNGVNGIVVENNETAIADTLNRLIKHPDLLTGIKENLLSSSFLELTDTTPFEKLVDRVINQ